MFHKVLWIEDKLLLVSIHLPIEVDSLIHTIDEKWATKSLNQHAEDTILVDAQALQPPLYETALADFQTILLNLESRTVVITYGQSNVVEDLLKRSLYSHPLQRHPIFFATNQYEAVGIAHHQQSANTTKQIIFQKNQDEKSDFRNIQTGQLYRAFVSDPERYRTWRKLVDGLYEDGEIVFESVMFSKLYHLGDTRDLSIDWDQVIMALLHNTFL